MITKHSCKSKKWIVQTNCPIEEGTDNQEKYLEAGKRTSGRYRILPLGRG
jgi:hypothetical protein